MDDCTRADVAYLSSLAPSSWLRQLWDGAPGVSVQKPVQETELLLRGTGPARTKGLTCHTSAQWENCTLAPSSGHCAPVHSTAMERNIKHSQMPNKHGADKENKFNEVPECFKHSLTQLFAAEKMRRQKEYANTIREQNKKINKIPITPTKEPEDKDREVPRMKVAQITRKEREQETSSSPSRLPEQLHVPEVTAELRDSLMSLCTTSSQPLVHTVTSRYLPQQENNQPPPCCLQGLESSPRERSAPITDTYKVLSPVEEPPRREDDEQDASAACEGYLVWMKKKQQSVIQSAIMAEKMRQKRENTNAKNKKINKIPITPTKEPEDNDKEVPRMKVAQITRKEREQETSSSPSRLPEQLHVPEVTAELRDSLRSLCTTSSQPLVHTVTSRYLPQQENNQPPPCCLQGLESSPRARATTMPGSYKVLSLEEPPRRKDDERSASAASDGCSQMEKQQFNTKVCHEGREQKKKKMKRIPFIATKKPKDKDAPRMKTLEFVKTLGTPMEGLDISQLSRLDFLIKQHKEEKRAIALLFK